VSFGCIFSSPYLFFIALMICSLVVTFIQHMIWREFYFYKLYFFFFEKNIFVAFWTEQMPNLCRMNRMKLFKKFYHYGINSWKIMLLDKQKHYSLFFVRFREVTSVSIFGLIFSTVVQNVSKALRIGFISFWIEAE